VGLSSSLQGKLKIPYKLIHLDLKGAPPKLKYLKGLLKQFKAAGCNGLLLEYEDMFPLEGILANTSHRNAYTKAELKEFLTAATELDLEIVPLIQTFGHLEFILKIKGFQKYRELLEHPQEICPSFDQAVNVVTEMIDQVGIKM
jgi:hexosaminidase